MANTTATAFSPEHSPGQGPKLLPLDDFHCGTSFVVLECGTVRQVDLRTRKLVLSQPSRSPFHVRWNETTRFIHADQTLAPADLQEGDPVAIRFNKSSRSPAASQVSLLRPPRDGRLPSNDHSHGRE